MTAGERRLTDLVRQIEVTEDEAKETAKEYRKTIDMLWAELRATAADVRSGQASIFGNPAEPAPASDEQPEVVDGDQDGNREAFERAWAGIDKEAFLEQYRKDHPEIASPTLAVGENGERVVIGLTECEQEVPIEEEVALSDEDRAALQEILDAVPAAAPSEDEAFQAALDGEGDGDAPEPEVEGEAGPQQVFTEAFIAGYESRVNGVAEESNPFEMGTAERVDWKKGWYMADGELVEEAKG